MENKQIILEDIDQNVKDFLTMDNGVYKNIVYYHNMKDRNTYFCDYRIKDGFQYFARTQYVIKKSATSYFLKVKDRKGFTVDPKGKINIWFGKAASDLPNLTPLFTHPDIFNLTWFQGRHIYFMTKSLLEKLISGKITNSVDYYNAWYKAMRIKGTGKYLDQMVHKTSIGSMNARRLILQFNPIVDNIDHFVQRVLNDEEYVYDHTVRDIVQQAHILGKKINPRWSSRRLADEHINMTREIMGYEIKSMESEIIPYTEEARQIMSNIPGITLLDTKAKIFAEGKVMSHCIYTNYYNQIKDGKYLCFNVEHGNESGTLTLAAEYNKDDQQYRYKINAFLGKRNRTMSDDAHKRASFLISYLTMHLPLEGDFVETLYQSDVKADVIGTRYVELEEMEELPF